MDRDKKLKKGKGLSLLRWFARGFVSFLAFLFFHCQVIGKENVPPKGPVIIIANHPSLADPCLIGIKLHREAVFMAKEELFANGFASWLLRSLGAFPVSRGNVNRKALSTSARALKNGLALVIFPEGGRSRRGEMKRGTAGAAMIAVRSETQILPVGIYGAEKAKGAFWFFKRPKVKIVFGKPFLLKRETDVEKKVLYSLLADRMMIKIAELLPKEYHGYYSKQEG